MSLTSLAAAFSDMYMKADKLEQGLISSYSDSKKRNVQRLMHGECGQIPNYIEVYQSYGIDLTAPYYSIVIISAASKELRFGPDNETILFTATLSKTSPPKFWGSSAASCCTADSPTFS